MVIFQTFTEVINHDIWAQGSVELIVSIISNSEGIV